MNAIEARKMQLKEMKSFKDLEFEYPIIYKNVRDSNKKQAKIFFRNGYGVSVLIGDLCYSNGINSYELAIINTSGGIVYDTHITNDVLGYLTEKEVTENMIKVQKLPNNYEQTRI